MDIPLNLKGHIVNTVLILILLLFVAFPILANTSNWAWQGIWQGYYINGDHNGVHHQMVQGTLTFSGGIWATTFVGAAVPASTWTFELWKIRSDGRHVMRCSFQVQANQGVNQTKFFSQNCGINGGKLYIVASRAHPNQTGDTRAYSASGNLHTP
ncbi:MAG: hypothetical protein MUF87_15165 [Anaerolineae bacterium]|nr:hypothetical protein [Anaerolineae bacterium]